jgi:hypothetical protein
VTYGHVAAGLREQLTWLLERHRIGQHLGGPGSFRVPVTTTVTERAVLGEEIQRYRDAVLTYCLEAVRAVTPTATLDGNHRRRDPVLALRHRLEETHAAFPARQPLLTLVGRRPAFELVARWQDAARLAVQGEREIAALRHAALPPEQQRVILKDTADLVRGLVILDLRYRGVPGWTHLEGKGRLLAAAHAASSHFAGELDLSVDHLGWRPAPGFIEGPALPGLAGVVQAQHNVAVDLAHFPSAPNLRHVLVAQADLSKQAAGVAQSLGSPTAETFEQRAILYRKLVVASRSLGGELGAGRVAAQESANAARRMTRVSGTAEDVERALGHLIHLDDRIDAKLSMAVEHGLQERLYFVSVKLPALGEPGPDGIARAAHQWTPATPELQVELLNLVRERLRTSAVLPKPADSQARQTRISLDAVVRLEQPVRARRGPRP